MTARQLAVAMRSFDMSSGHLARISGAGIDRVNRWLKGEDDIPVYVQRDFYVWSKDEAALDWAIQWADEHAQDVRAEDRPTSPNRGHR
jgi:phage terminase Nu1 subunit (DNA packaging protein)